MKISLALHPRRALNRSEAWGCFTANIALPGSGSLLAGRAIGYFQIAFAFVALGLTLVTGLRMMAWAAQNWSRLSQPHDDPFESFQLLWVAIRWPLAGIGLFVLAILFAMITSLQILSASPKEGRPLPPRL